MLALVNLLRLLGYPESRSIDEDASTCIDFRLLRLIAFMIVASLFGTVLAAEDVIELSAGCTLYDAIVAANIDN